MLYVMLMNLMFVSSVAFALCARRSARAHAFRCHGIRGQLRWALWGVREILQATWYQTFKLYGAARRFAPTLW